MPTSVYPSSSVVTDGKITSGAVPVQVMYEATHFLFCFSRAGRRLEAWNALHGFKQPRPAPVVRQQPSLRPYCRLRAAPSRRCRVEELPDEEPRLIFRVPSNPLEYKGSWQDRPIGRNPLDGITLSYYNNSKTMHNSNILQAVLRSSRHTRVVDRRRCRRRSPLASLNIGPWPAGHPARPRLRARGASRRRVEHLLVRRPGRPVRAASDEAAPEGQQVSKGKLPDAQGQPVDKLPADAAPLRRRRLRLHAHHLPPPPPAQPAQRAHPRQRRRRHRHVVRPGSSLL